MRILTLASQKGGTGKTTLAAHLAVEAERSKAGPVAVIDTDPQGSLAAWWNTREAATPLFAAVNIAQLTEHVQRLRQQGIKLVIIDTPPQTLDTINNANAVADFVLIPARPSPARMTCAQWQPWLKWWSGRRSRFALSSTEPRRAQSLRNRP
jgi:chromosome partitioning protein